MRRYKIDKEEVQVLAERTRSAKFQYENLQDKYKKFIDELGFRCSQEALSKIPDGTFAVRGKKKLCDAYFVKEYLFNYDRNRAERLEYKGWLEEYGLVVSTLDAVSTIGCSIEKLKDWFFCSAVYDDIPLEQYIERFVNSVKQRDRVFVRTFDLHKLLVRELDEKDAAIKQKRQAGEANLNQLYPFQDLVEELTSSCLARNSLINEIEEKIRFRSLSGYINLYGPSKSGKTTLVAEMVRKFSASDDFHCVWFFFQRNARLNDTTAFIRSIYRQLAIVCKIPDIDIALAPEKLSTAYALEVAIRDLINSATRALGKKLVILIDAIDEIDSEDPSISMPSRNLLFLPEHLLGGAYVVVTSSNFRVLATSFNMLDLINISRHSEMEVEEIKNYIAKNLKRRATQHHLSLINCSEEDIKKNIEDLVRECGLSIFLISNYLKILERCGDKETLIEQLNKLHREKYNYSDTGILVSKSLKRPYTL